MIEIGRIVMKIAGRDAGKLGVVLKVVDDNYVLIDGEVRRRKCNVSHLDLLNKVIKIKEDASNSDVIKGFKTLDIEIKEKTESKKDVKPRPKKVRKKKEKPVKEVKKPKKAIEKKPEKAPKSEKVPKETLTKKDAAEELKKVEKVEKKAEEIKPKTKAAKKEVEEIKEQIEEVKGEILEGKTAKKTVDKEIETIKKEEKAVSTKKVTKAPKE